MRNDDQSGRSIDALLRRQRDHLADPEAAHACVEAETLAAWMDGSLAGEALHRAEHHAAGCARCQAMLAAMARTAPATVSRRWWETLRPRWIVPLAAAATALALWVSVGGERTAQMARPTPSTAERAEAEVAAPTPRALDPERVAVPASPPPAMSGAQSRFGLSMDQKKDAEPLAKTGAPTDALARQSSPRTAGGAGGGQNLDALRPFLEARTGNAASAASPAAATPAPSATPPPAPPAAQSAGPPPAQLVAPLAETVTVVSESPAQARTAAGRAGGGTAFTFAVDVVSPEPAVRWRTSVPGTILRTTDGGATWIPQNVPATAVWAAGSAPARDVCWIVGRAGTVALSTDGATWQLRPFPEAVHLTAVRAVDARTAIVTTADGRQFSTADGGATWSKLPLQEK